MRARNAKMDFGNQKLSNSLVCHGINERILQFQKFLIAKYDLVC